MHFTATVAQSGRAAVLYPKERRDLLFGLNNCRLRVQFPSVALELKYNLGFCINMQNSGYTMNEGLIEKFLDNCIAEGLGQARIKKYTFILKNLSSMLGMDFDKAKREDIQALVIKIEKSNYADWTK